jgi:hypothetical protein
MTKYVEEKEAEHQDKYKNAYKKYNRMKKKNY